MNTPVTRRVPSRASTEEFQRLEWLVANGLGGYASGTIGGVPTRRYHGLLIAALPNPAGRVMMLNSLSERVRLPDRRYIDLGWVPPTFTTGHRIELVEFELELGLPVWRYQGAGIVLEKRLVMAYGHNTTVVSYRLLDGGPIKLELRPSLQFRGHDDPVSTAVPEAYELRALGARIEMIAPEGLPNLRFQPVGPNASFVIEPRTVPDIAYVTEESRGYASRGQLYSPGRFRIEIVPGSTSALVASTHSWETLRFFGPEDFFASERARRVRLLDAAPPAAQTGPAAELVLAADQFVIRPAGRKEDHVRARVAGDEAWSVIAGYHWFTDWGRDTMISLEGLCLATGRHAEAGSILRMFAHHIRDGLIPNMFPEHENDGLYHTADATLWFFHAIDRYVRASGDERTLDELLPKLRRIVLHHVEGTRFGIGVDPRDGLLSQGVHNYPLSWMDAKAGDWIVTPRRGKTVEINALWYNALRLMEGWHADIGDRNASARFGDLAERARVSFNERFWNPDTRQLYDLVDGDAGDDAACRPNQLFAISLPHAVLQRERWASVLHSVESELLSPVGLRSLSPDHPDFKPNYHGDLLTRDAAYHQGTVWSWLVGPYVDACLRCHPEDRHRVKHMIDGLVAHLGDYCVGFVGEVFDAEEPYRPGGCVAQAWGVAELLRCLLIMS